MTLASNGLANAIPFRWTYADATARAAASGFTSADLYSLALQLDNASVWVLTATTPTWTQMGGGFTNPMTTAGDLILGGSSGAAGRLAKGSDSQVLTVDPSTHLPVWATPSGSGGPGGRLGSAVVTSGFSTTSTSITDVTGASATVTVGSRRIKVTLSWVDVTHSVSHGYGSLEIWDATAGARVGQAIVTTHDTADATKIGPGGSIVVDLAPSAGSRTYKARLRTITAGTIGIEAGSDAPITLLVEEI